MSVDFRPIQPVVILERIPAPSRAHQEPVMVRRSSHIPDAPGNAIAHWRSSTISTMPVVVFLRGMNLGSRRITNEELISVFAGVGYDNVSAYQASGNVILGAVCTADVSLISMTLATELGYDVDVFVRTADQLRIIARNSPIQGRTGSAGGKPQIVFLTTSEVVDLGSVFPDGHEVHHLGTEIHWLPPTGLNELGPLHKAMDKALGRTTVRTLGTIERLAKRLS